MLLTAHSTQSIDDGDDDYVNYAQSEVAFLNRIFISLLHHSPPPPPPDSAPSNVGQVETGTCNVQLVLHFSLLAH